MVGDHANSGQGQRDTKTMTHRRTLGLLIMTSIVAFTIALLSKLAVSVHDADAINKGTSRSEVFARLGSPQYSGSCNSAVDNVFGWEMNDGTILIGFDQADKVVVKITIQYPIWQRIFDNLRKRIVQLSP